MTSQQLHKILEKLSDEELMRLSPLGMQSEDNPLSKLALKTPHPRQTEFLALQCEEALYGGAAGGGKTEALLMWLAEGIHLPNYSGILFRRTYAQLTRSNDSPVTKSYELYPAFGGEYKSSDHQWHFPSGAGSSLATYPTKKASQTIRGQLFTVWHLTN